MSVETEVARHYTLGTIEERLLDALRQAGKDPDRLDADELAPFDEFHSGGRQATEAFAPRLGLSPGARLLDVGSGVGGPARYFAKHHGCIVTGIDLTDEFVVVARAMTERTGLADRVSFRQGSALAMPFEAGSFDVATLFHVGMNIAEKGKLFAEARRVLKPNGVFGVYDVMRYTDAPLLYPVLWAASPDTSFVETPATYKRLLEAAGFAVTWERDCGSDVLALFREQAALAERGGAASRPGLSAIVGPNVAERARNFRANVEAGVVRPTEIVARAPAA